MRQGFEPGFLAVGQTLHPSLALEELATRPPWNSLTRKDLGAVTAQWVVQLCRLRESGTVAL